MTMVHRRALIAAAAAAATTTRDVGAFVHGPGSIQNRFVADDMLQLQQSTIVAEQQSHQIAEDIAARYSFVAAAAQEAQTEQADGSLADVRHSENSLETERVLTKRAAPKKKGSPHKEGVFSPVVLAAAHVLGQDELKKLRANIISLHSEAIKSFVDTSDTAFGRAALRRLFALADADGSGRLDRSELGTALGSLGFAWLGEKQVEKIFHRADVDGDGEISPDEFFREAPRTLRVNLVKLAKMNGGEMGLLV